MRSVAIVAASPGIGAEFLRRYPSGGWQVHASARSEADLMGMSTTGRFVDYSGKEPP